MLVKWPCPRAKTEALHFLLVCWSPQQTKRLSQKPTGPTQDPGGRATANQTLTGSTVTGCFNQLHIRRIFSTLQIKLVRPLLGSGYVYTQSTLIKPLIKLRWPSHSYYLTLKHYTASCGMKPFTCSLFPLTDFSASGIVLTLDKNLDTCRQKRKLFLMSVHRRHNVYRHQ